MPKPRTKNFNPPAGWELIEDFLDEMEEKMREAEGESNEYKRRNEALWPIFRIHHQRSRYIFEMFYKKKKISRELYQFCLDQRYADAALIAKWKKVNFGYEKLCCLSCMQTRDHNFSTTCICRVPKDKLEAEKAMECVNCGCRGCASGD